MKLNVKLIDTLLEVRGWTRYRLAHEMGVHPNGLYKTLKRNRPTLATINRLADALNVPARNLLTDK